MEKAYRFFPWLSIEQASRWLRQLTGTELDIFETLQLCEFGECPVYLNCEGWRGTLINYEESDSISVAGVGYSRVCNPSQLYNDSSVELIGDISDLSCVRTLHGCRWCLEEYDESRGPEVRPADIETLARKMNASLPLMSNHPVARSSEDLIRSRVESVGLNTITRVVGVDAPVLYGRYGNDIALIGRLLELLKLRVVGEELVVTGPVDSPVTGGEDVPLAGSSSEPGIAFPYATRELKAMHAAAMKYWADYTPDKRQPTQKEIGIEIGELLDLSLQSNNEPARKAIVLASAIKPDSISGD